MSINYPLCLIVTTQILTAFIAPSQVHSQGLAKKPNFLVTDYDFVDTNVKKVCLLALVDASVHLRNRLTGSIFNIPIPEDSSIKESYCNRNFKSLLALRFDNNVVKITFSRSHEEPPKGGPAYYCTYCNYGQWNIAEMNFTIRQNGTEFHAATVSQTMKDSFPPVLAGGITLSRSFRCQSSDAAMKIPLTVNRITNVTDGQHMNAEDWTAGIHFTMMEFQPFLVGIPAERREHTFSDPVLCKDVTASHVVVILLPLIYFAILIACYHIKRKYGFPICKKKKKPGKGNEDPPKFTTSEFSHRAETYDETKS